MKILFEDLRLPKSKPVVDAINRLMDAGVALDKIAEGFSSSHDADEKIIAVAEASQLIKEKAISYSRLGLLYDCNPREFGKICNELQEMFDRSPEKYFQLTKNNWDFLTHFIAGHKSPRDFELFYLRSPKEFNKQRSHFA